MKGSRASSKKGSNRKSSQISFTNNELKLNGITCQVINAPCGPGSEHKPVIHVTVNDKSGRCWKWTPEPNADGSLLVTSNNLFPQPFSLSKKTTDMYISVPHGQIHISATEVAKLLGFFQKFLGVDISDLARGW